MKTLKRGILYAAIVGLLNGSSQCIAIEGLEIGVQNTNVVISWPSSGFETFLIQSRPTLDPGTPWVTVTNNYPANSANRTTYTVYGVVPPPSSGGGSTNPPPPPPPSPLVFSEDKTPTAVPFDLYPPGFDLSGHIILWPDGSTDEWSKELAEKYATSKEAENDGPQPEDSGGDGPECQFFRVFLVPDFWYDYSQYTFNFGEEFMPMYLGVDPQLVASVKLLVDGQVFPYAAYDLQQWDFGTPGNPDIQWTYGMRFQSDRLTNGTHTLQVVTTLRLAGWLNEQTPYLTLTSPAFTTTVGNPIIFKPWKSLMVGTNHTFNATTTIYPADWEIDVWDANGFWVTSATGTTTNGNISWTWDFYDDFAALRDDVEVDPWFDPWVTVTSLANGPSVTRPAPLSSPDYPYNGGWIIGFQDNAKHLPAARDEFIQMFFALAGGPPLSGLSSSARLLKYGNTNDVDMTPDPVQNMIDRNASWDALRDRLLQPLFRNLYVFAHGGSNSIGGDWEMFTNSPSGPQPVGSDYDPNTYTVGTNQIRTTAYLESGWCYRLRYPSTDNPHPYRFVFLDGCSTATGDWPYAFSMVAQTNALSYYQADGDRPNAFVGWNITVAYANRLGQTGDGGWGDYRKFANFRTEWMSTWRNPVGESSRLDESLGRAQRNSGWITPQKMREIISIYGWNGLEFNGYNQRTFSFPP